MITTRNNICDLLNTHNYKSGAEIGVQNGDFSKTILSNWGGHLTLIDCWEHTDNYIDISNVSDAEHRICYENTINNIKNYKNRCTIIKDFSIQIAEITPDNSFDFVYIDANHSYDSVYQDITVWISKVKAGGFIGGHDYLNGELPQGNFGVKKAVKDFFNKEPDIVTYNDKWPSWFIFI